MRRHEIDCGRSGHLGRNDEIALVLAVLVVDQHEHAPIARLVDDLVDRGKHGAIVVGEEERLELAQRFCRGIPSLVGAVA